MSSLINGLPIPYVPSVLATALQKVGLSAGATSTASAAGQDSGGLSPLAQTLSELQQLQQSDPAKYQQVTQQIAANLESAAQTATANGNTAAASQLSTLATDFTNASQSGQLPNVKDLAQALHAGGHHHHHHSGNSASQTNAQNDPLNPLNIITSTLESAGVTSN